MNTQPQPDLGDGQGCIQGSRPHGALCFSIGGASTPQPWSPRKTEHRSAIRSTCLWVGDTNKGRGQPGAAKVAWWQTGLEGRQSYSPRKQQNKRSPKWRRGGTRKWKRLLTPAKGRLRERQGKQRGDTEEWRARKVKPRKTLRARQAGKVGEGRWFLWRERAEVIYWLCR